MVDNSKITIVSTRFQYSRYYTLSPAHQKSICVKENSDLTPCSSAAINSDIRDDSLNSLSIGLNGGVDIVL